MVLQFAACLLKSEEVFESFCRLVLDSDDGTGLHCELVHDFLKERSASEKVKQNVEQMVRQKLQENRGTEYLIAGLCHPSLEMRNLVLSEMKKFGVPPNPFAQTDGVISALKQAAEDDACKWHERAAAILSISRWHRWRRWITVAKATVGATRCDGCWVYSSRIGLKIFVLQSSRGWAYC